MIGASLCEVLFEPANRKTARWHRVAVRGWRGRPPRVYALVDSRWRRVYGKRTVKGAGR